MKRETRRAAIRASTGDKPGVTLKTITPNIVDDFGSVFMADAFDASIKARKPVLCWGHDWAEPLGPFKASRAADDGAPEIDFEFSDFDAVPMARRAHAQVRDGTIVDCSVGFSDTDRRPPTDEEKSRWPGCTEVITKASLDEVSLVLRGAVPGAKVVSVRSGKAQVDLDAVVDLARRVAAGEITQDEAQAAVDLLSTEDNDEDESGTDIDSDAGQGDDSTDTTEDMTDDLDAALALIGRAAPRREKRFVDVMADDVRSMLSAALRGRYPEGDRSWLWVRDFNDVEVIFDKEGYSDPGCYRHGYSMVKGQVVLETGEAMPVVPKTSYVPRKGKP